jgi:hypothetical protein
MHGREAICPLDLLVGTSVLNVPRDLNQYAGDLVTRLKEAFQEVARHSKVKVERMKRDYDANVHTTSYKPLELVYYYYPRRYQGRSSKWSRMYIGPFRVEKVLNDVNYVIRKSPRSKPIIVHVDKLQRYYGPMPACWSSLTSSVTKESVQLLSCENRLSDSTTEKNEMQHGDGVRHVILH